MQIISEDIQVEMTTEGLAVPVAFTWRDRRVVIRRVLAAWVDTGFGAGEVTRTWYRRRHRNGYRVLADDGLLYEFYLNRSGSRRQWVLARCLGTETEATLPGAEGQMMPPDLPRDES